MAKFCEVCGKGTISGNSITHSDRKIRRTWKPNVRRINVLENGVSTKKFVCTRCIRSGKVQRAIQAINSGFQAIIFLRQKILTVLQVSLFSHYDLQYYSSLNRVLPNTTRSIPKTNSQIFRGKICTIIMAPITASMIPTTSVNFIFGTLGPHFFLCLK